MTALWRIFAGCWGISPIRTHWAVFNAFQWAFYFHLTTILFYSNFAGMDYRRQARHHCSSKSFNGHCSPSDLHLCGGTCVPDSGRLLLFPFWFDMIAYNEMKSRAPKNWKSNSLISRVLSLLKTSILLHRWNPARGYWPMLLLVTNKKDDEGNSKMSLLTPQTVVSVFQPWNSFKVWDRSI